MPPAHEREIARRALARLDIKDSDHLLLGASKTVRKKTKGLICVGSDS